MRSPTLRAPATRLAVAGALLFVVTRPLSAQFRADPGAVINGKVVVTMYVTLGDLDDPYVPLSRFQLVLHGPQRDSTVLRTDDAGVVSAAVPAGNYRVVSSAPFTWKGRSYRWSLPVTVRGGMPVVDLTANNAVTAVSESVIATTGIAEPTPSRDVRTPVPSSPPGRRSAPAPSTAGTALANPKDGGIAVLFSLLVTGGGQMYAGRPGKGVALLLTSVGAVAVGASASECTVSSYSYDTTCDVTPLAIGFGIALGNWIYSMVSAPGDVRTWNATHAGVSAARVVPVVAPGAAGTQLGLALRW